VATDPTRPTADPPTEPAPRTASATAPEPAGDPVGESVGDPAGDPAEDPVEEPAAGTRTEAEATHDHAWRHVDPGPVSAYSDYQCRLCGITWSL
jgi:hypothetical protein